MNQDLLLKLKETGFPQKAICPHGEDSLCDCQENFDNGKQTEPYRPNLSELIEACGDRLAYLEKKGEVWEANGGECISRIEHLYDLSFIGSTPEEAVAKLWLSINDKEIK